MESDRVQVEAKQPGFRLGGVARLFLWLAVLGPALPELAVLILRWGSLSPELQGMLFGSLLAGIASRAVIWVSLVSLASVLLWRLAGRRRWAGQIGSALMLTLCALVSCAQWVAQRDAGTELSAVRAESARHARAVSEALRNGTEPPSDAEYLSAQAARLERAARSGVRRRGMLAGLAAYHRESAQIYRELEDASAAVPEAESDCSAMDEADLAARIAGMTRLRSAAEQARDFEARAVTVLRASLTAQGESAATADEVMRGMAAAGAECGSRSELFAQYAESAALTLRALEFLRDHPGPGVSVAASKRIASACATPEFRVLAEEADAASERIDEELQRLSDELSVAN